VIKELSREEWKNVTPSHEKLWIWQRAHKLHIEIWEICKKLPRSERYILKHQIERSSKSVQDNIAEANSSYYFEDKKKGLFTARKEAGETQNHLKDFQDKKYLPSDRCQAMIDEYEEIKRGINGLVRTISERKELSGRKGKKKI
jgi:four helix bundle protein